MRAHVHSVVRIFRSCIFVSFLCSSNDTLYICHRSDETTDIGHSWQRYVTILIYIYNVFMYEATDAAFIQRRGRGQVGRAYCATTLVVLMMPFNSCTVLFVGLPRQIPALGSISIMLSLCINKAIVLLIGLPPPLIHPS